MDAVIKHLKWKESPVSASLNKGEVHLWKAALNKFEDFFDLFFGWLSKDEIGRYNRYRRGDIKLRFVTARGLLRAVLSMYTRIPPAEIQFDYGNRGKPKIRFPEPSDLQFNLSHSHNLMLAAFTIGRQIGVDIEYLPQDTDIDTIARGFFSTLEREALEELSQSQRKNGFYNCWTRKEAYMKAVGDGFSIPLDSFSVSLVPGAPARILSHEVDPQEVHHWQLVHLDPDPDYTGALAVEDQTDIQISLWHLDQNWVNLQEWI